MDRWRSVLSAVTRTRGSNQRDSSGWNAGFWCRCGSFCVRRAGSLDRKSGQRARRSSGTWHMKRRGFDPAPTMPCHTLPCPAKPSPTLPCHAAPNRAATYQTAPNLAKPPQPIDSTSNRPNLGRKSMRPIRRPAASRISGNCFASKTSLSMQTEKISDQLRKSGRVRITPFR